MQKFVKIRIFQNRPEIGEYRLCSLLTVHSSASFRCETSFGQVTAKKPSKILDFLQKSDVTLFTPKMISILAETIKVSVQTWNAIPF